MVMSDRSQQTGFISGTDDDSADDRRVVHLLDTCTYLPACWSVETVTVAAVRRSTSYTGTPPRLEAHLMRRGWRPVCRRCGATWSGIL
jgi:hypothetical protein